MVVTVASDACFADESKCSLEFGQRMLAVKTKAAVVVGTAARDETRETVRALDVARRELDDFEGRGYGERFGPGAQPGEVRQFKENSRRLAEYEAESARYKTELAEVRTLSIHPLVYPYPSSPSDARVHDLILTCVAPSHAPRHSSRRVLMQRRTEARCASSR
jgi:hypothetical protein